MSINLSCIHSSQFEYAEQSFRELTTHPIYSRREFTHPTQPTTQSGSPRFTSPIALLVTCFIRNLF